MEISKEHLKILDFIIKIGMDNVSRVFSKTIKRGALIEFLSTKLVDIMEITEEMNNDLREMVGAIIQLKGEFQGKLLFMIPFDGALLLQDLYLGSPEGTSKEFNELTEGTVQEIGNVLASSISNTLASDFGSTLLPTPPRAVYDFAGTIFSTLVLEGETDHDKILLIETRFKLYNTEIDCYFFLLPDINTLEESLNKFEKLTSGD